VGPPVPAIAKPWQSSWDVFIPFLAFPPEVRRAVYTTNMTESINYQLRKVTKTRGHFPTERGGPAGTRTWRWKGCLNSLSIYFPGRINIT